MPDGGGGGGVGGGGGREEGAGVSNDWCITGKKVQGLSKSGIFFIFYSIPF